VKYAIIIADGAADVPIDALGGRTALEAARTPNLDALAKLGRLGTAVTTPPGFSAGSDVCSMSLLGYDPARFHTGRAPLEAAALGLALAPTDWIFRLNFVTVGSAGSADDGLMLDHSAGGISDREARELAAGLAEFWRQADAPLAANFALTPGVSYRNILVDSSAAMASAGSRRAYGRVVTTPPHEIPRQPWRTHLPRALKPDDEQACVSAEVLNRLLSLAAEFLPDHPVNIAREQRGLRPANFAWIWGQGSKPAMPAFSERYGLGGAMITAVDLLAGIAALMGWDRLDVPGVTSYHDTDYAAQGRATADALEKYDVVCCHVESPDEASHQGDHETKVAAIEAIDRHVVGPVAAKLRSFGDAEAEPGAAGWRLLVMPDHYTLVSTRKHDATPPPVLIAGAWIRSAVERGRFTEALANQSDLRINPGHELMEYFLFGGLARVQAGLPRRR
jgi:2,3-bisphosphoglycerate-independent phosphoglycerate mutase